MSDLPPVAPSDPSREPVTEAPSLAVTPARAPASYLTDPIEPAAPAPPSLDMLGPVNPLSTVDPDALTALFDADPDKLSDHEVDALILDVRRRRNVFAAKEAAASLGKPKSEPKPKKAKASTDPHVAALRDKAATGELSLADLMKGEDQ